MQHKNVFTGGMKRGIDYAMMPQDSYLNMTNGTLISKDMNGYNIVTKKGTTSVGNFGTNEYPISAEEFNDVLYILTYDGTYNRLYFYRETSYESWLTGLNGLRNMRNTNGTIKAFEVPKSLFGFSSSKLVEMIIKDSYDGSVDIYLCDGLNPNIVINSGTDSKGYPTSRYYTDSDNINKYIIQSSIGKIPTVEYSVKKGGLLSPGTYYFYVRYEDESLNQTPFFKEIGPIYIHPGSNTNNNITGALNVDNAKVDKRIMFSISNIDTKYININVAYVYYYGNNNLVSRENYLLTKSYNCSSGNLKIIFDGNNDKTSITTAELLVDNIDQNTCETQTHYDGRYVGANWKGNDVDYNMLRKFASLIIPRAIIKDTSNFDIKITEDTQEFEYKENEIYPLGVSFLIDGVYKTDVFPIMNWYEGYEKLYPYKGDYINNGRYKINVVVKYQSMYFISRVNGNTDVPGSSNKWKLIVGLNTVVSESKSIPVLSFVSKPLVVCTLGNVGHNTINVYVNITSDGGSTITEKGILLSTSVNPTLETAENIVVNGNYDIFSNLESGTKYYVRSYANNIKGTGYSNQIEVYTLTGNIPGLEMINDDIFIINQMYAELNCRIINDGYAQILSGGFLLSTSLIPTLQNSITINSNSIVPPDMSAITGALNENTTYRVRPFATNKYGTGYLEASIYPSFQVGTDNRKPLVITNQESNVTLNSFNITGSVLDSGWTNIDTKGTIQEQGFVFSRTESLPTIMNNYIVYPNNTDTSFTKTIPNLQENTLYYVRAYAKNEIFIGYGSVIQVTTLANTSLQASIGNIYYEDVNTPDGIIRNQVFEINIINNSALPNSIDILKLMPNGSYEVYAPDINIILEYVDVHFIKVKWDITVHGNDFGRFKAELLFLDNNNNDVIIMTDYLYYNIYEPDPNN